MHHNVGTTYHTGDMYNALCASSLVEAPAVSASGYDGVKLQPMDETSGL